MRDSQENLLTSHMMDIIKQINYFFLHMFKWCFSCDNDSENLTLSSSVCVIRDRLKEPKRICMAITDEWKCFTRTFCWLPLE